jgi:hypothetical protein
MNFRRLLHRTKRESSLFSDAFNVILFLLALAVLIGVVSVLDPSIKRWFVRVLS